MSGLKGQFILAPGNAWGKRNKEGPVRANTLISFYPLKTCEFYNFFP